MTIIPTMATTGMPEVKMDAANLMSRIPKLTWEEAIKQVSSKFLEEQYQGLSENLKPLTNQNTVQKQELLVLKGKEVLKLQCTALVSFQYVYLSAF
jgi:hypothetical protein